ncbi:MAG: hypothetical protein WDM84_09920 [Bauldia sp.]
MFAKPVVALAMLAVVAGFALARPVYADPLIDGITALPGNVEDVRIGGSWTQGSRSGVYRILIARSSGDIVTARLFVQWIAYDDNGGSTVQDTVEIQELADLKVDIVDFTSESDSDGLTVTIQTLDPNGSADKTYVLTVTSPSQHTLAPASN